MVDDVLMEFAVLVEDNVAIAAEFTDTTGELTDIVEEPYEEEE